MNPTRNETREVVFIYVPKEKIQKKDGRVMNHMLKAMTLSIRQWEQEFYCNSINTSKSDTLKLAHLAMWRKCLFTETWQWQHICTRTYVWRFNGRLSGSAIGATAPLLYRYINKMLHTCYTHITLFEPWTLSLCCSPQQWSWEASTGSSAS